MKHERLHLFNTRDVYPGHNFDSDMCMVVKAGQRLFLRGQTGLDLNHRLVAPEDAAAQADQAMQNVKQLLEDAGSSLAHVCKVTTYITDRAYRVPVYNTVGRYLKGIPTVATGLIVKGLAMPEMKMEIDVDAVIPQAGAHQRFRVFNTGSWFNQSTIDRDSCMVIRTDDEIYLRGQTGAELDGSRMLGLGRTPEDAALQADKALQNAQLLLTEAGSSLDEVCKLRVYIGDRAYREPVYQVLGQHFGDVHPCSTGLIMRGFARPEILCEIDMAVALAKARHTSAYANSRQASNTKTARTCAVSLRWPSGPAIASTSVVKLAVRWTASLSALATPRLRPPKPWRISQPCWRKPAPASTIYVKSRFIS